MDDGPMTEEVASSAQPKPTRGEDDDARPILVSTCGHGAVIADLEASNDQLRERLAVAEVLLRRSLVNRTGVKADRRIEDISAFLNDTPAPKGATE